MAENKKKSIVETALSEITQLKEAMEDNTKEILRTIAVGEINGSVNESLNEDFDNEEEDDNSAEAEVGADLDVDTPSTDAEEEEVIGADSEEEGELDLDLGSSEEEAVSVELDSQEGGESYGEEEDTVEYDFTDSPDEDVIAVYKKLKGDDEIEIVNDNEVRIKDNESGNEYHVKLDGETAVEAPVADMGADVSMDDETMDAVADVSSEIDMDAEEETEYEVSLEDEEEVEEGVNEDIVRGPGHDKHLVDTSMESGDIEGTTADKDSDSGDNLDGGFDDDAVNHANAEGPMVMEDEIEESEELDESIPVGNAEARRVPGKNTPIKGAGARALAESKEYKQLKEDYASLVKENEEFKSALKQFRGMLSEVAVFNSNLTYATKIFTEHATSQAEKKQILSRFDNEASTIKESKQVYKNILDGLTKKTAIKESVSAKLTSEPKISGQSQINESTAYEDASTLRMKELMKKVANR
jgi:hypothetical protein